MISESFYYSSTFWHLVQAIRDCQVVAFVGAGVSRSVRGTPGWNECIDKLIDAVQRNSGVKTDQFSDFLAALKKGAKNDPLFVAEQCRKYLQDKFPELVREFISVDGQEDPGARGGLELFMELPFYRIVTTNYDNLLLDVGRNCHPDRRTEIFTHLDIDYFAEFLRNSDSDIRRSIFHLHGHFDNPDSVILTEAQYQALYSRKEVVELMEAIFSTKSALFIGFSLTDLDVMQIFRRIIAQFPSFRERHFAILANPKESTSASWLDALRYNYKYGVGILNYELENESHRGLWKLVESLHKEVHREMEQPKRQVAILIDKCFPYVRNLYEIVGFLNRVQAVIHYCIHDEVNVNLPEGFMGSTRDRDPAFEPLIAFGKNNKDKYDGTFVFTKNRESHNYFFFDRAFGGFISTWFWTGYVHQRPSIDEFLQHALVLLTIHFYDQKFNRIESNGLKVLEPHEVDRGCLFDLTKKLRNRIAIIDYPRICNECQQKLAKAFQGREMALGIDWLRKVIPLAE